MTENNIKIDDTKKNKIWKKSRIGLFVFGFLHFIFELIISDISDVGGNYTISVIVNFYISRYFIKRQIFEKNKIVNNPFFYGIGISLIVFCFRLLFGFLVGIFLL